jgi:hypothetical protein
MFVNCWLWNIHSKFVGHGTELLGKLNENFCMAAILFCIVQNRYLDKWIFYGDLLPYVTSGHYVALSPPYHKFTHLSKKWSWVTSSCHSVLTKFCELILEGCRACMHTESTSFLLPNKITLIISMYISVPNTTLEYFQYAIFVSIHPGNTILNGFFTWPGVMIIIHNPIRIHGIIFFSS